MTDLTDKVAIVTGATNGIGEVTAGELARMGATTLVVSRNESKCQATVNSIRADTGNENVSYMAADLSDMSAVRELAAAIRNKFDRIDILVNNAGAIFTERIESVDGHEMTFALNHLNYFLLTHDLLDLLKATAARDDVDEVRVVNVSSEAHRGSTMQWDDLMFTQRYSAFATYAQSKLANLLFTYELARRLQGTGIVANAVHPGLVATGFGKNTNNLLFRVLGVLIRPFGRTPEKGAETNIYLAASPAVKGVTGKYFADSAEKASNDASQNQADWTRLWEISEELVGAKTPA